MLQGHLVRNMLVLCKKGGEPKSKWTPNQETSMRRCFGEPTKTSGSFSGVGPDRNFPGEKDQVTQGKDKQKWVCVCGKVAEATWLPGYSNSPTSQEVSSHDLFGVLEVLCGGEWGEQWGGIEAEGGD